MAQLTRADLVKSQTKAVELKEGSIIIRALTAGEAMAYRGKELGPDEIFGMLAQSICEPALTIDDVRALPVSIVNEIVAEVLAFNALGGNAIADAQAELKKAQMSASTTN